MLHSGLVTVDGMRLVEIALLENVSPKVTGFYYFSLWSGGARGNPQTAHNSQLVVWFNCPASRWRVQGANLRAMLASLRFTRPKG
jgi:hypothetical protein